MSSIPWWIPGWLHPSPNGKSGYDDTHRLCPFLSERATLNQASLDLIGLAGLTFFKPDLEKFLCLGLALEAGRQGGSMPVVLNAANETAVSSFLSGGLPYQGIPVVIEDTMEKHQRCCPGGLEEILVIDRWARRQAESWIDLGNMRFRGF